MRSPRLGRPCLAMGLIGCGVFGLASGTFALDLQPVPAWVPGVVASPGSRSEWSELLASWIIGAAVWVVADWFGGRLPPSPYRPR